MSNATGERTFSTTGRTIAIRKFPLIPPGNYTGPLLSEIEVGRADRPDAAPYVNLAFAVNGTAASEGGKPQRVYHMLFLGLKPGKDGVVNMDRENGLTALAQALGTQVEGVEIVEQEATDAEGNPVKVEYLNSRQVVEWLKSFVGVEVAFRIKTEKGTGGYEDKSKIAKFLSPAL